MVTLANRAELYIPHSDAAGTPVSFATVKAVTDKIAAELAAIAGGCTESLAQGRYVTDSGQLLSEAIRILTVYASDTQLAELQTKLAELAETIRAELAQESVMYTVNNVAYIVQ